ncbi:MULTISPECIES: DUF5316 family protein [Planomicrobium]|uniref:DUF5316 family protein n=1 Tax=Planomicrobium okeanokoites TaxID=244 RepID=A0ABV7KLB5_PLAOK|nr:MULTISPECIES: DUF5316 family protein [Planomicrobium]MCM3611636.1 DUF5316 domain-containing protein [Planococcus sp. MER TA 32b]PKH11197.1 hypothetical protein CXF70_05815 [Planomicrobium sp. MB-3u-38]TAA69325.1 hypothetical protein D2910_08280 [Planomicrobium okeanokoites]
MKFLGIGIVTAAISLLLGYFLEDWNLAFLIAGILGIVGVLWALLFSGVLKGNSGMERMTSSERRKESARRNARMRNAFLFALPNLLAALAALWIF